MVSIPRVSQTFFAAIELEEDIKVQEVRPQLDEVVVNYPGSNPSGSN